RVHGALVRDVAGSLRRLETGGLHDMLGWFYRGLTGGRVTTRYPQREERLPEGFRGRPVVHPERLDPEGSWEEYERACLPGAIRVSEKTLTLDLGRCICCGLCASVPGGAFT